MDIQLSQNFKRMTFQAILSIVIFILVYLILLALGVVLTALCIYGGIMLIVAAPKFITIVLGIGIASLGIMVFIFLIKFLFKTHTTDLGHLEEIEKDNYPRLFEMIEDIAKEADTKTPKKVYLSNDVNAAVFYNSSFWSMFFPIRKNLMIGMGLVNTVTEQELKAILAHEFGHFSQRTMSVGSYVYNVNQVIFNMLYDNESFDNMIQAWASLTGYFSIFVIIAVKLIQGIQWILQKMYGFVNLKYMALSREMEFHADEVAANIAGSRPLEDALLRMDLANRAYSWVLDFYDNKAEKDVISKNIFKEQLFVLGLLAKENKYPIKNSLPVVEVEDLTKYNKSKINIKDQWASHPTTEERVDALKKLNIAKTANRDNPAMDLFPDKETIEEELTKKTFYNQAYRPGAIRLDFDEFKMKFSEYVASNRFPDEYNEYYDNKNPNYFDVNAITDISSNDTLDTLFGKDKVNLVYNYIALENDKNILVAIMRKEIAAKTFDYDGQRYKRKDAKVLIDDIEKEIAEAKKQIDKHDVDIYKYFYTQAVRKDNGQKLKDLYTAFFDEDKSCDRRMEIFNGFVNLANMLRAATSQEGLEQVFNEISRQERDLKKEIKALLENPDLDKEMNQQTKDNFDKYLSRNWSYSANDDADTEYLEVLFRSVNDFHALTSRSYFLTKLNLLNFQVEQNNG